jgi:hypothetical protein
MEADLFWLSLAGTAFSREYSCDRASIGIKS